MAISSPLRPARPAFAAGPAAVFLSFWQRRELIAALVARDVLGRYRGSYFGVLWSLVQPLVMLAVYTFVFGVVMQRRWGAGGGTADFALTFFAGLIVFNFLAECVNRAPGLVVSNPNFVKKVVFPLDALSWVTVGSALFHFAVSFAAWLVFDLVLRGVPAWTTLWLPLLLLPLALFALGLSWLLASLGVFVRDVGQFVSVLTTALMFLSPVFYEITAVPERLRAWLYLNPVTFPVLQARRVLLDGATPDAAGWLLYLGAGFLVAWLGLAWFQRTRSGFADVV